MEKQKVSNINEKAIDVVGLASNELMTCVEIFFVRGSKMVGREHYFFDNYQTVGNVAPALPPSKDMPSDTINNKEILTQFIKQYYIGKVDLPSKIMIEEEIDDLDLIEKSLERTKFRVPQRGEKVRFIEMAKNNARITLENRTKEKEDILNTLKEMLKLDKLPRKIECFDISNLAGTFGVRWNVCGN